MIYSVTLLLAALLVFFIRKSKKTAALAAPLRKLPFFKVHYFLAGAIFSLVIPDGFEPAFQSVSGPVLIFCVAWVGLFFGCGLDIRYHQRFSRGILLNNIIHPALVFAIFMTAGAAYVQLQGETFSGLAQFYLIALCCVFSLYRRHGIYYRTGNYPTIPALEDLLPVGHVIPVILLGIAAFFWGGSQEFVIFGHSFAGAAPFFLFQTVVAIAAGMVLNMLIAGAPAVAGMTAVLAGMAAMLGGIAYSATFSPLFMGTVAGAYLTNGTLKRMRLLEALNAGQNVVERIFMFLLGAWISPLFVPGGARIGIAIGAAVLLFLIRGLLNYALAGAWIARAPFRMRSKTLLWVGLTGQGTLAGAAVMESSLRILNHPTTIAALAIFLILNQLAFGFHTIASEHPGLLRRR